MRVNPRALTADFWYDELESLLEAVESKMETSSDEKWADLHDALIQVMIDE